MPCLERVPELQALPVVELPAQHGAGELRVGRLVRGLGGVRHEEGPAVVALPVLVGAVHALVHHLVARLQLEREVVVVATHAPVLAQPLVEIAAVL